MQCRLHSLCAERIAERAHAMHCVAASRRNENISHNDLLSMTCYHRDLLSMMSSGIPEPPVAAGSPGSPGSSRIQIDISIGG